MNPDTEGYCAWCESIFDRKTGKLRGFTTDEQEEFKLGNISHGICPECSLKQMINSFLDQNNQDYDL